MKVLDLLKVNRDGIEHWLTRAQRWPVPSSAEPDPLANLLLTLLLLVAFGWGFLETTHWSFRTALFPRIVTVLGFMLTALHLVQAVRNVNPRHHAEPSSAVQAAATPRGASAGLSAEHLDVDAADDEADGDLEYLFRSADRRTWTAALGWVLLFFLMLHGVGLYVTAGLFSLLYLRFAGGRSWVVSIVYAVVLSSVLYLVFEVALNIATPTGVLLP